MNIHTHGYTGFPVFKGCQRSECGILTGATGLDKWSQKRFHEARLKALGAKPEKNHRIPANLGYSEHSSSCFMAEDCHFQMILSLRIS